MSEKSITEMLSRWFQNQQIFEGEFAKMISKYALLSMLDYSTKNLSFAGLSIKLSPYNNECKILSKINK